MKKGLLYLLLCCCAHLDSLAQQPATPLFHSLPPAETGVAFTNMLKESPALNIISYEYFYNGGGVGLGDFNNDGLVDIYLTANMQPARLYLNKGNLKFEDITAQAGVGGKRGWKTGVSIADVNGDGLPDIYVCYSGPLEREQRANELFINNGNLTFSEKAAAYGVADSGYSTQGVFFDYDRDNDLDLFVVNHNNKNLRNFDAAFVKKMKDPDAGDHLYRNDGHAFTDVTTAAGIIANPLGYGLGVAVSDLNNDGWPDLLVTNDYVEEDYLYINNHNGTFSEQMKERFGHISNFSMGCDIADINNDGLSDVFTLDMLPEDNRRQKLLYMPDNYELYNNQVQNGFHHQLMRNMLQLNNGDGTFSEIGQVSGVFCTDWSWASLLMDFNNDGNKDLFITNGYGRDMTNRDFVKFYANERLKFVRGEPSNNMFNMLQSIPVTPVHDYLYLNKGNLQFADVSTIAGFGQPTLSNGAACADLDNDGDLDLVINHLNATAGIYRNMLTEKTLGGDWLQLRLKGPKGNTAAIGAMLRVYTPKGMVQLEQQPVHGYQSAMHVPLHSGLPASVVDSVWVQWPDGIEEIFTSVQAGKINEIGYGLGKRITRKLQVNQTVFSLAQTTLPIVPAAPEVNDFKMQPLMPAMVSNNGPRIAKGDVNGDGIEDLYVCGAQGVAGQLLVQTTEGQFLAQPQPAFEQDAASEDTDALFFDADKDGDLDLYVVSGGYNFNSNDPELQDRLYLNTRGLFTRQTVALPAETLSGSCVKDADVDGDGDSDLFVGTRVIPGRYPESAESLLLLNDGHGHFQQAPVAWSMALQSLGMVTDAEWIDLEKDGRPELLVGGDWMRLRAFGFEAGRLTDITERCFPDHLEGWWNRLHLSDMDGDGDADLVAGNWGLNSPIRVSKQEPATLVYHDFDNNGSVDPLICYSIQGKSYPMATRDEMTDQMVSLRQRFPTYDSYAQATIEDVLAPEQLQAARKLSANHFETTYFQNDGGVFRAKPLPVQANFAPVYAIATADFDHDGRQDILLAGNMDHARIKIGKMDAGFGTLLKGDGKGGFSYVPQMQSGLQVSGCTRDLLQLQDKKGAKVLFAVTNSTPVIYSY